MVTLIKPTAGDTNWADKINGNWTSIENELSGYRKRFWAQVLASTGTGVQVFGSGAVTTEGSVVQTRDSDLLYYKYTTAAVANSDAGWYLPDRVETRREWNPALTVVLKSGSLDLQPRIWVGLFSGDPMGSATPSLHYAAFRYDFNYDNEGWYALTDDGSGTPTITGRLFDSAFNTKLTLRIVMSSSDVKFYVNTGLVATHTTHLPAASQGLGPVVQLRCLSALPGDIGISKWELEQD